MRHKQILAFVPLLVAARMAQKPVGKSAVVNAEDYRTKFFAAKADLFSHGKSACFNHDPGVASYKGGWAAFGVGRPEQGWWDRSIAGSARRLTMDLRKKWYARGVGLVKDDEFELPKVEGKQ
ncbi:MAG: hypothetical protein ACTHLN_16575 [Tepidisphaeraceae bacterium]